MRIAFRETDFVSLGIKNRKLLYPERQVTQHSSLVSALVSKHVAVAKVSGGEFDS